LKLVGLSMVIKEPISRLVIHCCQHQRRPSPSQLRRRRIPACTLQPS
jgi:hypothetical protein